MVECVRPEPGKLIADPACGTGGFFLAGYDFITNRDNFKLDKEQKALLKHEAFHGNEIVANTRAPVSDAFLAQTSVRSMEVRPYRRTTRLADAAGSREPAFD